MRSWAGIVIAGLLAGAASASVPEPSGFRLDHYRAPVPDTVAGGTVVHTDALKALLARGGVILIDVLPAPRRPPGMLAGTPWMPETRMDIPGSIWLPDVGRGAISAQLDQWFRQELTTLSGGRKDQLLVFYCLADCWMSWNAAKRAALYGYTNVTWYPDGSDGWHRAGLALSAAKPEASPP